MYLFALIISTVKLLSSGFALHYGVHSLQVRRISHHSQPDVLVRHSVETLDVGAQVVLDVTGTIVCCLQSGKLGEDLLQGLAAYVGKDVQTTW